jgi:hypothetical protein
LLTPIALAEISVCRSIGHRGDHLLTIMKAPDSLRSVAKFWFSAAPSSGMLKTSSVDDFGRLIEP